MLARGCQIYQERVRNHSRLVTWALSLSLSLSLCSHLQCLYNSRHQMWWTSCNPVNNDETRRAEDEVWMYDAGNGWHLTAWRYQTLHCIASLHAVIQTALYCLFTSPRAPVHHTRSQSPADIRHATMYFLAVESRRLSVPSSMLLAVYRPRRSQGLLWVHHKGDKNLGGLI